MLLRGVLVLSGVLFIVTIILPLPAFDWVVRVALLAILVVTPIIFSPNCVACWSKSAATPD